MVWQTRLGSQVSGAPASFSIKGRQYIAVVATGMILFTLLVLIAELSVRARRTERPLSTEEAA